MPFSLLHPEVEIFMTHINRLNFPNAQEQEYSFIHDMGVDST
jgi:hypothetical protein